jgi:hypothetical protein
VGKGESTSPAQIGSTEANDGIVVGVIVMVSEAGEAHSPGAGVNEYTVVCVLSNVGDQVPVIPFVEVNGNGEIYAFAQYVDNRLNIG